MNEQKPGSTTPAAINEGLSTGRILLFLLLIGGLLVGGLYYGIRTAFSGSNISLPVPDLSALGDVRSLIAAVEDTAKSIQDSVQKDPEPGVNDPTYSKLSDKVGFRFNQHALLEILINGEIAYTFEGESEGDYRWIGAIHDPYSPLVNLSGTPFFSGEGLPIKPANNIVRMTNDNGQFEIYESTFKPFPFFSSAPTTIGIIEGYYEPASYSSHLRMTFIDLKRGLTSQILSEEIAFPQWFKKGGYPPAYATQKYIVLHPKNRWHGAMVYQTLMKFRDGQYQKETDAFHTLCARELSQSMLSDQDIKLLRKTDLNSSEYNEGQSAAVQKLVRVLYYSKQTGASDVAGRIVPLLHPSIQNVVSARADLMP